MKTLLWIGMLCFFMFCNNTNTTSRPNDADHTRVSDSNRVNTLRHDSFGPKKDTAVLDSLN